MPTALVRVVEPARLGVDNPNAATLDTQAHAVVSPRPSSPSYEQMAMAMVGESATWYGIIALVVIGRLLWATARTMVRGEEGSAPSRSSG